MFDVGYAAPGDDDPGTGHFSRSINRDEFSVGIVSRQMPRQVRWSHLGDQA